jgi:hypothetical protein
VIAQTDGVRLANPRFLVKAELVGTDLARRDG